MKKITLFLIFILAITLCSCGNKNTASELKDVAVQSDYIKYKYEPLKQASKIIVRAEVQDELSGKNSKVERDSDDPDSISDFGAVREVKILAVYQGDKRIDVGSSIKVIEDAAIDDGYYFHGEDYRCLEKGKEYILFLNNDNATGEYSIISANNGKVCTSDLKELDGLDEENYEIAVKTLVEYDSDLNDEEKASIIKNKVYRADSKKTLENETKLSSGTMTYENVNDGIAVALNNEY